MRGRNGSNELAVAYIHGRIDAKIESTIEREIEIWSDKLHVSAMEIKQRMGTLSVREEPDSVPRGRMPKALSSGMGNAAPEVEVVGETRTGAQARSDRHGNSENAPDQVKSKKGPLKFYQSLTPEQQVQFNLKRLKKRKDPIGKKMYKSLLAKATGKVSKKEHRAPGKQAIYRARFAAKKAGLPVPPLPGETPSNPAIH